MDAFVKAAAEALTPGDPGRPKLSDETRRIRQLEAEKKRLENELYEMKAISELQGSIIAIRDSQLAEREKKERDELPVIQAISHEKSKNLQPGSRSCQVSNGIKGSNATDYAGLRLDCTGGPAILFPFFAQSAEEPEKSFPNT